MSSTLETSGMGRGMEHQSLAHPEYPNDAAEKLSRGEIIEVKMSPLFLDTHIPALLGGMTSINSSEKATYAFGMQVEKEYDNIGRVIGAGLVDDPKYPHFNYLGVGNAREHVWPLDAGEWQAFFNSCEALNKEAMNIAITLGKKFDDLNAKRRNMSPAPGETQRRGYEGSLADMIARGRVVTRIGSYVVGERGGPDSPQFNECCFAVQWWASSGKIVAAGQSKEAEASLSKARTRTGTALVFPGKELAATTGNTLSASFYQAPVEEDENEERILCTSYIYMELTPEMEKLLRSNPTTIPFE